MATRILFFITESSAHGALVDARVRFEKFGPLDPVIYAADNVNARATAQFIFSEDAHPCERMNVETGRRRRALTQSLHVPAAAKDWKEVDPSVWQELETKAQWVIERDSIRQMLTLENYCIGFVGNGVLMSAFALALLQHHEARSFVEEAVLSPGEGLVMIDRAQVSKPE
jgi:hypothetical protein